MRLKTEMEPNILESLFVFGAGLELTGGGGGGVEDAERGGAEPVGLGGAADASGEAETARGGTATSTPTLFLTTRSLVSVEASRSLGRTAAGAGASLRPREVEALLSTTAGLGERQSRTVAAEEAMGEPTLPKLDNGVVILLAEDSKVEDGLPRVVLDAEGEKSAAPAGRCPRLSAKRSRRD